MTSAGVAEFADVECASPELIPPWAVSSYTRSYAKATMQGKSVDLLMKARRRLDVRANSAWTEFHPFRSPEARAEYFAALEQRERRWPIPAEERMVETSWAKTFVRVGGPADGAPLVLMHGAATNSVSRECNIQGLSEHFRTYAVDNPYDVGRSVYVRDAKSIEDYPACGATAFPRSSNRDSPS